MTDLNKRVERISHARIFERSKDRAVIIILEPPSLIGFRLKGTKRSYYLPADACYMLALKADLAEQERHKKPTKRRRK